MSSATDSKMPKPRRLSLPRPPHSTERVDTHPEGLTWLRKVPVLQPRCSLTCACHGGILASLGCCHHIPTGSSPFAHTPEPRNYRHGYQPLLDPRAQRLLQYGQRNLTTRGRRRPQSAALRQLPTRARALAPGRDPRQAEIWQAPYRRPDLLQSQLPHLQHSRPHPVSGRL